MALLVGLAALLLSVAGLTAFGAAALRWGVDSREGSSDPRLPHDRVGIT